ERPRVSQTKQRLAASRGTASPFGREEGRAPIVWALLLLLQSAVLCFVPLFDLLGYELALAIGPLAGLAALHLGLREVAHARTRLSRSARELADVRPFRTLLGLGARAWLQLLPGLLLPVVLLSLNALRVRNCNPAIGLLWYAVLPLLTAGFGACIG